MSALRWRIFAIALCVWLAAVGVLLWAGPARPIGVYLFVCSVVGGLALVFERWRYTRRRDSSGGNWVATGEKFVDPTSGERFEVFYDPLSGQRDYRPTPR